MNRSVATALGVGADAVQFGVVAPERASDVRALEAAGITSLWVGGHVASHNPSPEAISWLARLVEQSERAVLGTATLLLPLYPPAIVAKQLADLDRASDGRLAVGVGIGGEYPSDFAAAEVPLTERGSRTDEAIGLLRRFWTAEAVSHHGPHHSYDSVRIHPAPAQPAGPPIIVTGRKIPAMRRAVRLGDGWMPYLYSADRYRASVAQIYEIASTESRDLSEFAWSCYVFVSIDRDADRATRNAVEFLGATYRQDVSAYVHRVMCAGTPESVAEQLVGYVDAGVRHFVLAPIGTDRTQASTQLIDDVLPRVRRATL